MRLWLFGKRAEAPEETKATTQEEVLQTLDGLYHFVSEYRKTETFKKMLAFVERQHGVRLGAFNAHLVWQQMVGAKYVLSAHEWQYYGRSIKATARPLAILNYAPVGFVFDVSETEELPPDAIDYKALNSTLERIKLKREELVRILRDLEAPYRAEGRVECELYQRIIRKMAWFGIACTETALGGTMQYTVQCWQEPIILNTKKGDINWCSEYLIKLNCNSPLEERFLALVCGLSEILLGYHRKPETWEADKVRFSSFIWHQTSEYSRPSRINDNASREFEIATVRNLVGRRLGVLPVSDRKLATLLEKSDEIPPRVSVDRIMKVTDQIEGLLSREVVDKKKSWLYKYDKEFRKEYDSGRRIKRK